MKWKTITRERDVMWQQKFVWLPTRTQDGYTVWMESVWYKWKVHQDGGKFIYRAK